MKELKKKIEEAIKEIESDERYNYPPANVFVNAPLALIQIEMKGRVTAFKQALLLIDETEGGE